MKGLREDFFLRFSFVGKFWKKKFCYLFVAHFREYFGLFSFCCRRTKEDIEFEDSPPSSFVFPDCWLRTFKTRASRLSVNRDIVFPFRRHQSIRTFSRSRVKVAAVAARPGSVRCSEKGNIRFNSRFFSCICCLHFVV